LTGNGICRRNPSPSQVTPIVAIYIGQQVKWWTCNSTYTVRACV